MTKTDEIRICDARGCPHCHHADGKPRPLSPADVAWQFSEAEGVMGIRSSHGAIVDMAQSGIQDGGRTNGVENRMTKAVRLAGETRLLRALGIAGPDPVAKHRCIRARLAHLPPSQMAVLQAAYGPDDWTRTIGDKDVCAHVQAALRRLENGAGRALPLTPLAIARAAAHAAKPRPSRPRHQRTAGGTIGEKLRRYLEEQPGLAGSARGAVISAACSEDKATFHVMTREAVQLVAEASRAAQLQEQRAGSRIRSCHSPVPSLAPELVLEA